MNIKNIIVVFCLLLFATGVEAQRKVTLNNDKVTVTGDSAYNIPNDKRWSIVLSDPKADTFRISKEDDYYRIKYKFNKKVVVLNNLRRDTIPYNTNGNISTRVRLVISKSDLPLILTKNNDTIAIFDKPVYRDYNQFNNKSFQVGDTLKLDFSNESNVEIKSVKISLTSRPNSKQESNGDSVSINSNYLNDGKEREWNVSVTTTYNNGHVDPNISLGTITVKPVWWRKYLPYGIILILVLGLLFHFRKQLKRVFAKLQEMQSDKRNAERENLPEVPQEPKALPEPKKKEEVQPSTLEWVSGEEYNKLNEKYISLQKSLNDQIDKLANENKKLTNENKALKDGNVSKKDLRGRIDEQKAKLNKQIQKVDAIQKQLNEANKRINKLASEKTEKENVIRQLNSRKEELESRYNIAIGEKKRLETRLKAYSRQKHYLYLIDDLMDHAAHYLQAAFQNVTDDSLRKSLATPVMQGRLDTGLETSLTDWRKQVLDNQEEFFGGDILSLTDDDVKKCLGEGFVEPLALRDSMSRLARLYRFSQVGWIAEKLTKAGFDVAAVQEAFVTYKTIFDIFGVKITCPRPFIDDFDGKLHKDNMRCDVFSLFGLPDNIKQLTHQRPDVIVDVIRIGVPSSKNPARRLAEVSLSNQ